MEVTIFAAIAGFITGLSLCAIAYCIISVAVDMIHGEQQ